MIDLSTSLQTATRRAREEASQKAYERMHKKAKRMPLEAFEYSERPTLNDHILAKNCGDILEKKYPGWEWAVGVGDGLVRIHSGKLDMQHGYVLHADKIDNDYRAVVRAGGEILERYRMPRNGFKADVYLRDRRFGAEGRGGIRLLFDGDPVTKQ